MEQEILAYLDSDGNIIDTQTAAQNSTPENIIPFDNSAQALEVIRHSTAHLMAQAIKELYPDTQFFVGPVVDEGFYYDFRVEEKISEEDLKKIEKKMKELIKKKYKIEKYEISKTEAIEKFAQDDLKQAVLSRIPDETVSIYKQGDFEDLCRGPHVPALRYLHNFKLTRIAGAYLGGDENAEMLTRIYGIAFADKESLKAHMLMLEEAKNATTESWAQSWNSLCLTRLQGQDCLSGCQKVPDSVPRSKISSTRPIDAGAMSLYAARKSSKRQCGTLQDTTPAMAKICILPKLMGRSTGSSR